MTDGHPLQLSVFGVSRHRPQPGHGYTIRLLAQVKDGVLDGHTGPGQPGSLALSGNIQPDGKATIDASGTVGDPSSTANRLRTGTPYAYKVAALFDSTRGVGNRIEVRPCTLTFVK